MRSVNLRFTYLQPMERASIIHYRCAVTLSLQPAFQDSPGRHLTLSWRCPKILLIIYAMLNPSEMMTMMLIKYLQSTHISGKPASNEKNAVGRLCIHSLFSLMITGR